ncbi:hypothetical protein LO762_02595 [Actinocorallia sp. API 0066]|uniref:hypothetical protein n=1 Tax=Actinocorallia sp. API 0066 TaxID=2896846 RepID=UPI001E37A687|nr:hypothetical protein [Actinocorallia sp. API 0066]MCD0448091.1 hypothetical protein [Actinocorallia sp. API 0066]
MSEVSEAATPESEASTANAEASPAESAAPFPEDVLEAGAELGEPVADEEDPRRRTLLLLIGVDLLGVAVLAVGAAFAPTLHPAVAAAWAVLLLALLAHAGVQLARRRALAVSSVVLFDDGLVHATESGLQPVPWTSVKLAYLTPGKRVILHLEDNTTFTLKSPVRNLARLEAAIRTNVPRDQIRRGTPPRTPAAL